MLVDPFNLRTDLAAWSFTDASVRAGAVVMSWYPLYGPTGHPDIDALWDSLSAPKRHRSMRVEVGWGKNNAAVMCGAGIIIANVTDRATLRRLDQLRSSLQPLFNVCGKVLSNSPAVHK